MLHQKVKSCFLSDSAVGKKLQTLLKHIGRSCQLCHKVFQDLGVFLYMIISITIMNGICGMIITHFNKPVWNRHRLVTGIGLSILAVIVFIATRQPYAGIVCFAFLVIKGFLIAKTK